METNSKTKVLLIHYQLLRGIDSLAFLPSLALGSLAANLDKSICDVKIFEFNSMAFGRLKDDDCIFKEGSSKRNELLQVLNEINPDIAGLTCKSYEYYNTLEIAKIIKSFNKNIITVLGGYHATIAYEEILGSDDHQYIDYIVRCEGEKAFNDLVKAIHFKKDVTGITNISFVKNGKAVHNPAGNLLKMNEIKIPERRARLRKNHEVFGYPVDMIETSRGCVFDCSFCCIREMYGKSFRTYEIERIIEDIIDAKNNGANNIFFADDNITLDIKRFEKICDAIITCNLSNLGYAIQASVKGLKNNPALIRKMALCGIKWVFLGVEAPDDDQLKFLHKSNQFKRDDIHEVVNELKRNRILVHGGIIFGLPDESEESIKNKAAYVENIDFDLVNFFILTPYPSTEVRKELSARNLITNYNDYSKYDTYNVNIKTDYLSSNELFKLVRMYERKYNYSIKRIIRFIYVLPNLGKLLFSKKILSKILFK